jgi:copper homeostasis protein
MTTLEIAVETLADAIAAEQGGADSVEISRNLARDGLTPSLRLVQQIRDGVGIDVHVIVRPHDRDFIYSEIEFQAILANATALAQTGIASIVFGAHRPDGHLHVAMIRAVAAAAAPLKLTLHRAIDSARDPDEGLQSLSANLDRVLSAGPAATAWQGRDGLRAWQQQFGQRITFIAAGRLRADTLAALVQHTGVGGVHVGSAARQDGVVTADKVAQLRRVLDGDPD